MTFRGGLLDEKMMRHKTNRFALEQSSYIDLMQKRLKTVAPLSSKEKKKKLTERIKALQQLVSPYGKTDTASVLLEAVEYIRFLHEQVKVLSAPYLFNTPTESQDVETSSLRAKGLCLVPISFTSGVASSNGADIWAVVKTNPTNSRRLFPDEASIITQT